MKPSNLLLLLIFALGIYYITPTISAAYSMVRSSKKIKSLRKVKKIYLVKPYFKRYLA